MEFQPNEHRRLFAVLSELKGVVYELDEVEACDHFVTWLMFQPTSDNSIPIPIKKVNWYWDGAAEKNVNWIKTKGLPNEDEEQLEMVPTFEFPIWSGSVPQLGWKLETN